MLQLGMKAKIWLGLGVLGAGYVVFLLLVQWTAAQSQAHLTVASVALYPAALSSQEADAAYSRMVKGYNDAVLLQNVSMLGKADMEAEAAMAALQNVKAKTSNSPELQAQVSGLIEKFTQTRSRSQSTYAALIEAKDNVPDSVMSSVAGLAKDNKEVASGLTQLRAAITTSFQTELETVSTWSQRQRVSGVIVFIVVLICAAGVGTFTERSITKPLRELVGRIDEIAQGDGDLTRRLEVTSKDEVGKVSSSFNTLMEKLQEVMLRVASNAERMAQATSDLSISASELAQHSSTQQSQAIEVSTSMLEMALTVTQVSDNSNQAANSAREAGSLAREGGKTVESTVKVILEVAKSTRETAEKIQALGKSSDQIGRIVGVIDDIADQTNLLALNAAIEAARAGDQGRGFAVVADEVRKLAERTSIATKEIAEMIKTIQQETHTAVEAMKSGTVKVDEGVNSAREAGEALQKIIKSAENVQDIITQIATAATEQASATEQVKTNMEQIADLVKKSSDGAQNSAQACNDLSGLSSDLIDLISRFKLGNHPSGTGRRGAQTNDFAHRGDNQIPDYYAPTSIM
jgi:methyl-accepting chemotaxis protein